MKSVSAIIGVVLLMFPVLNVLGDGEPAPGPETTAAEEAVAPAAEGSKFRLPFEVGVGYQALLVNEYANGVSLRCWFSPRIGFQASYHHFRSERRADFLETIGYTSYFAGAQLFYAPIVRENSRFYLGFEGGYGYERPKGGMGSDHSFWAVSPLFGVEYRFQGLPEIGFNFEVGYRALVIEQKGFDIKYETRDIWVGFGAAYYF